MQKQRSSQFFSLNGHFLAKILGSKGRRPQKWAKKDQHSFFLEIFKSCLIIMKFLLEGKNISNNKIWENGAIKLVGLSRYEMLKL
jgi:hypothetical protein